MVLIDAALSARSSRTAWMSRIAGSARLTMATRLNTGRPLPRERPVAATRRASSQGVYRVGPGTADEVTVTGPSRRNVFVVAHDVRHPDPPVLLRHLQRSRPPACVQRWRCPQPRRGSGPPE